MLISDMPNMPPQPPSIVMVAQINQAQQGATKAERAIGVCELAANMEDMNVTRVSPVWSANAYFQEYEHRNDLTDEDVKAAKFTILQLPKHGTLAEDTMPPVLGGDYIYTPNKGYVGKDSAVVLVEIKGIKVKVFYYLHMLASEVNGLWDAECGKKGGQWKIATYTDSNGNITIPPVDYQAAPIDTSALKFERSSGSGLTFYIQKCQM